MRARYRIACITNPLSGYNKTHGLTEFDAAIEKHKVPHKHVMSGKELEDALRDFAKKEPEILIINGGDGTVDAAITLIKLHKMFKKTPMIALLQGGTTNMIHRDLGLVGKPHKALERLLSRIQNEIPKKAVIQRAPLAVYEGTELKMYGFFWAIGAIPQIIKRTRTKLHSKGMTGRFSEALTLISSLFPLLSKKIENDPVFMPVSLLLQADMDKAPNNHEMVFAAATTLQNLVLGLHAGGKKNKITFFGLPYPYKMVLLTLFSLLRGKPMADWKAQFFHKTANAFEVSFVGEWILDGEIFQHDDLNKKLHIEMSSPLEFIRA